jgi:hypothetical protein
MRNVLYAGAILGSLFCSARLARSSEPAYALQGRVEANQDGDGTSPVNALRAYVEAHGLSASFNLTSKTSYAFKELQWIDPKTDDRYFFISSPDFFAVMPRPKDMRMLVDFGVNDSLDVEYTNPTFIGEDQKLSLVEILSIASRDSTMNTPGMHRTNGNTQAQHNYEVRAREILEALPK